MATILVAASKGESRQDLASLFGHAGHRVLEAQDGGEALALVASHRPDLLFTDVSMPVIDGVELTRRIRDDPNLCPIPVVFYTATGHGAGFRRVAAELDVAAVIAKPAEPQAILNAIGGVLGEAPALQRQVIQAKRMEALGALAGGVAHDINNCLVPILSLTELLLETLPTGSREHTCIELVHEAGGRIRDLVRRILVFSRCDETPRAPIDLAAIFVESANFLRATLPASIELCSRTQPGAAIIEGDVGQIQQLLLNLCINAADAIAAIDGARKGAIDMLLDRIDLAEPLDAIGGRIVPGRYYRLQVADNGCGMDEATIVRIFEPFYTTKPSGKGTGLGLAMVHAIVGAHSGHLRVTSRTGAGTTFETYLPAGDDLAGED